MLELEREQSPLDVDGVPGVPIPNGRADPHHFEDVGQPRSEHRVHARRRFSNP